jgi:intracellular sulfur oxidation DsrE/DsrF family protein
MIRRTFLAALAGAGALLAPARAVAQGAAPARHAQDDWLDRPAARHRVIFDTWMADKFGEAFGFAGNWARINKEQYGLTDADLAIVMVARHGSGPFAFNEAIWTKYGTIFQTNMSSNDKSTNPSTNRYAQRLADMGKQGLRLAVCNLTTRNYTNMIAKETGSTAEAVYKELTSNTAAPAVFVPAGIVAVTRAQERGYALVSIG